MDLYDMILINSLIKDNQLVLNNILNNNKFEVYKFINKNSKFMFYNHEEENSSSIKITNLNLLGRYFNGLYKFILEEKYRRLYQSSSKPSLSFYEVIGRSDYSYSFYNLDNDIDFIRNQTSYINNVLINSKENIFELRFGDCQVLIFIILYNLYKKELLNSEIAIYYDICNRYVDFYLISKSLKKV